MIRTSFSLPGWLALWLALAAPLGALDVRETLWSFDGHFVPERFNPLSVLVANPGDMPFDGEIVLASTGGQRGPEYVLPLYLAPHTTRWVQFQVFMSVNAGEYALRWGRGAREHYEVELRPTAGPPACVWLRDADNPFTSSGAMKSFPDVLFPTTLAATDGLDAVVLDYAPRWEAARREAFLDWLKRGGTVHLLPASNGQYPVFSEVLEVLNGGGDVPRIGLGRVVRHQISGRELSEKYLAGHGYPARTLRQTQSPIVYDLDALLLRRLSGLTRPAVSWSLIQLLTLAYIAAIGPLHYRFRRRLDYRLSIGVFLGVVIFFATALGVIGRRGYGESQTVHSLTIARALGDGRHDVTQWISAFATAGDIYTLTHAAPANLYAAPSDLDAASTRILNGKDGRMLADIPLYSSKAFVHRAVMTGDDTAVTVEQTPGKSGLRGLRLRPGPGFPKQFSEIRLRAEDSLYEMEMKNGDLEVSGKPPESFANYFSRTKLQPLTYENIVGPKTGIASLVSMMPLLLARTLGVPEVFHQSVAPRPLEPKHLELFIVAPVPPSFCLQGKGFTRETGSVLYVQDVFQP